jgi:hypothetical protein
LFGTAALLSAFLARHGAGGVAAEFVLISHPTALRRQMAAEDSATWPARS